MQHIFFDLDGTLTDPKLGITSCVQYAPEELGHIVPPSDNLEWVIGPPLPESVGELLINYEMVGEAMARYRERFAQIGSHENEAYKGVPKILTPLRSADKTDLLAYAVESLDISAHDAAMVGESKYDMIGTQSNNIVNIGVSYGYGGVEELTTAGADHLEHDCAQLCALLLKIN